MKGGTVVSRKALREFRYKGQVIKAGEPAMIAPRDVAYLVATGRIEKEPEAKQKRGRGR